VADIEAVVKATGKKQTIPSHWLDHPTIGPQFRLTAREKKAAKAAVEAEQDQPEQG
jgi:hypothetical protein